GYFVEVSHHAKGPSLEEFLSKLDEFEGFLLRYILPSQLDVYDSIDDILANGPRAGALDDLRLLISRNRESYRYFFANATAKWLDFLVANGLISGSWPVAEFLLRIAPENPEAVSDAIITLDIREDPRIVYRLVGAVNTLPLDLAARVVRKKIIKGKWARGEAADLIDHPLTELLEKLIAAGRKEGRWLLDE